VPPPFVMAGTLEIALGAESNNVQIIIASAKSSAAPSAQAEKADK
jgi:hypothetical protein